MQYITKNNIQLHTTVSVVYLLFPCAAPAVPVTDIIVTRVNDTTVRVTWTALTLNDARGFPSYVVSVMSRLEQVSSQRTSSTSVVVGGLMPHTVYSVTVQALTAGGTKEGPLSDPGETEMHHMYTYSYSYHLVYNCLNI